MNSTKMCWASALLLAATAQAGIVQNSYWADNHNFISSVHNVKIEDGITYGNNAATDQLMRSGWSLEGHPDDYDSYTNVNLVKSVFPASTYSDWFPSANSIYSYDSFLRAVAKYPAFCGEHNAAKGFTA